MKKILVRKPQPPCNSIQYEVDIFDERCPKCGSSMARKWLLFKTGGCIQPECENWGLKKKTHKKTLKYDNFRTNLEREIKKLKMTKPRPPIKPKKMFEPSVLPLEKINERHIIPIGNGQSLTDFLKTLKNIYSYADLNDSKIWDKITFNCESVGDFDEGYEFYFVVETENKIPNPEYKRLKKEYDKREKQIEKYKETYATAMEQYKKDLWNYNVTLNELEKQLEMYRQSKIIKIP